MSASLVQSNTATTTTTVTSLAVTLPAGVTAGNLLVLTVGEGSNLGTITGPTGWSQAFNHLGTSQPVGSALFYLLVDATTAGQTSWTVTLSAKHTLALGVMEWHATNGWAATPLDVTALLDQTNATVTTLDTGLSATTTNATDLVVALFGMHSGTQTNSALTAGYTQQFNVASGNGIAIIGATLDVSATGTQEATTTIPTASYAVNGLATFKELAASGGTNYTQTVSDSTSALDAWLNQTQLPLVEATSALDGRTSQVQRPLSDATAALDGWSKQAIRPTLDAQSGLDGLQKAAQRPILDAQSGVDGLQKGATSLRSDAISATDALSRLWSAHLTLQEAISASDAAQKAVRRAVLETFSQLDHVSGATSVGGAVYIRQLTDATSATDVISTITLLKWLGEAFSATDSVANHVQRTLQERQSAVDSATRSATKAWYDGISGQDGLRVAFAHVLADALSLSDTHAAQVSRSLLDAVSSTDRLSAGRVLLVHLLDAFSLTDVPLTSYTKAQFGVLNLVTSLVAASLGIQLALVTTPLLGASLTFLPSSLALSGQLLTSLALTTLVLPETLAMSFSMPR